MAIFRVAPPENFTSRSEGESAVSSSTSYFHHLFPFEISSDKSRVTGAFVMTLSSLSIRRPTTRKQRTVLSQEKGVVLASYDPSHSFNIEPLHRSRSSRIFPVHNRTTTLTMGVVAEGEHFIVGS